MFFSVFRVLNLLKKNFNLSKRKDLLVIAIFIFVFVLGVLVPAQSYKIGDFANYYTSAKVLVEGKFSNEVYDVYKFNQEVKNVGIEDEYVSFIPFPPTTPFYFLPLTFFEPFEAKFLWNLFSFCLLFWVLVRISSFYKKDFSLSFFVALLCFVPLRNNFYNGQAYIFLLFLLTETFLAYQKEKRVLASILLSLSILLKITPAILLFHFLLKKDFKSIFYTLVFCVIFSGLTLLAVDFEVYEFYLTEILPRASQGFLQNPFSWSFQSFDVLLKNLFLKDTLLNPRPLFESLLLLSAFSALFKGTFFSLTFLQNKNLKVSENVKFVSWLTLSLLISATSATYHFVLLLLPLLVLCYENLKEEKESEVIFVLLASFVLFTLPYSWFASFPEFLRIPRFWILLCVFMFFVKPVNFKDFAFTKIAFALLFFFPFFFNQKTTDLAKPFFSEAKELLAYKISDENGYLFAHFLNSKGEVKREFLGENFRSVDSLQTKNNQIFFKEKQITDSKDRNSQPFWLDEKTIVFLTERCRGVGFPTVYKLELQ